MPVWGSALFFFERWALKIEGGSKPKGGNEMRFRRPLFRAGRVWGALWGGDKWGDIKGTSTYGRKTDQVHVGLCRLQYTRYTNPSQNLLTSNYLSNTNNCLFLSVVVL